MGSTELSRRRRCRLFRCLGRQGFPHWQRTQNEHLCAKKETLFALVSVRLFLTRMGSSSVALFFVCVTLPASVCALKIASACKSTLPGLTFGIKVPEVAGSNLSWTSFAWWNWRMTLAFMSVSVSVAFLVQNCCSILDVHFWQQCSSSPAKSLDPS